MTRAMLLCAGLSTRLRELSLELPKPLLPVCDVPILRYGIANLVGHGIRDIVINLHLHGELIEREIGDGSRLGARVQYTREEIVLGTGGGLKHALPLLDPDGDDEPIISLNGKLIFDLDIAALLASYRRDPDVLGMMVVRRVPDAREWGAVKVEDDGGRLRVRDILGDGEHMFCGVHVTRPSVLRRLPDGEACMVRQGYLPWLRANGHVAAHVVGDGYFAEHSTPDRYLESSIALLSGAELTHPPAPLRGIDPGADVDPGAEIRQPVRIAAGARVASGARVGPGVVIGRGATVEPGTRIERSVVWPGARVSGDLANAIVTTHTTLVV